MCATWRTFETIFTEFEKAWQGAPTRPKLRIDEEETAETWNVEIKYGDDDKLKWMSKIAFAKFGLVGIDVKSHQTISTLPYPYITIGNDKQDRNCEDAKRFPKIDVIKVSSGGSFAYLCKEGNMVIGPINKFLRGASQTAITVYTYNQTIPGKGCNLKRCRI